MEKGEVLVKPRCSDIWPLMREIIHMAAIPGNARMAPSRSRQV